MSDIFTELLPLIIGIITGLSVGTFVNLKRLENRVKELEERID